VVDGRRRVTCLGAVNLTCIVVGLGHRELDGGVAVGEETADPIQAIEDNP